ARYLGVDRDLGGHLPADLGGEAGSAERGPGAGRGEGVLDLLVGRLAVLITGPGQLQRRVRRVPVGADQGGRAGGPVGGDPRDVRGRHRGEGGGDRLPV